MKKTVSILTAIIILFLGIFSVRAEANDNYIDVFVYMKEDTHSQAAENSDNDEEYIVELKKLAEASQEDLIRFLEDQDQVHTYEGYYISNLVHIIGSEEVIREVSKRDDVAYIERNEAINTPSSDTRLAATTSGYNWNMDIMDFEEARENYGISGRGVTIGYIDSGVDFVHPEIMSSYRGYDPLSDSLNHEGNYVDILGNRSINNQHATAIISIGSGSYNANVTGAAPGSKWILARTFDTENASNNMILKGAEWMIAPGGDPNKRPDIVNNSWGGDHNDDKWFYDVLHTWKELDIFSVFAAGNDMDGNISPGSIENPADLPEAFAVGSISPDKSLSYFSKVGPSELAPGRIKPEVVAPGENIKVAYPGGRQGITRGTSAATPHISGLVALLMEARPDADVEDYKRVVIESAEALTSEKYPQSPNMGFGYGLPNAQRALNLATKMKVTDRVSGTNRFNTAEEISSGYYKDGADTVYITNGYSYVDALMMSTLTNLSEGPLLLSASDSISQETLDEIKRLNPNNIVVIGGNLSINDRVLSQIERETGISPTRVAGPTRYATSTEIAKRLAENSTVNGVYLVNGTNEVDAISVSGPAKYLNKAVLLTGKDLLPEEVSLAIEELDINDITIVGGEGTISKAVEEALIDEGYAVRRLGGSNRYETSMLINRDLYTSADNVYLANGIKPVDALTVAPVAASQADPVLLVPYDRMPDSTGQYINSTRTKHITILGGSGSISQDLEYSMLFY